MWIAATLVGVVLIILIGQRLFRKDTSRSAVLMEKYRRMTPTLLAQTPDEECIEAVVSNLLALSEQYRKDPYVLIPTLSQERTAVYSLWLLQKELGGDDPTVLRHAEHFGPTQLAADSLEFLGFAAEAEDLRNYLQTAEDRSLQSIRALIEANTLTSELISLIRLRPTAFCDENEAEIAQEGD